VSEEEYCNICENFPCLGNHPPREVEEALERYERAAAFIRQGWVTRAELERSVLGYDAMPAEWPVPPFSIFRDRIPRVPSHAQQQLAEVQGRAAAVRLQGDHGASLGVSRCR
jgi:hypothetical protein